jgi:hypothetical protein
VRIPVYVAGNSIGCGHLIPFDVGSHSFVMWAEGFRFTEIGATIQKSKKRNDAT